MALRRRLSPGLPLSVVLRCHLSAERARARLRFCYDGLQVCKPLVHFSLGFEVEHLQVIVPGQAQEKWDFALAPPIGFEQPIE